MNLLTSTIKCEVPTVPARGGWLINPFALTRVIEELELRYLVSVRYTSGYYKNGGAGMRYPTRRNQITTMFHRITISQDKPLESANRTLWHELRHCYQRKEFVRLALLDMDVEIDEIMIYRWFRDEYRKARGRHGASYEENSYEMDARSFAEERKETLLLWKLG